MRIPIDALPTVPKLFLDFLEDSDRTRLFYSQGHSLDDIEAFARQRRELDSHHRERLTSVLETQQKRWGLDTSPIEKLRRGAVAVVTGQQAGLFTGPMYSVLKGLTSVKVARELESRGVEAVPVFWIASEDHDREEIEWAGILTKDSTLHRVQTQLGDGAETPVGWLRFRPAIRDAIEECFRYLPASEFQDEVRCLLEEAYAAEASPVDAFARMMGRLFRDVGLAMVDPLDSDLRSLSHDVLVDVADRIEQVRSAVRERSRKLTEVGYPAQVRVDENFTGLFTYRGGRRQAWVPGERIEALELSPNVLLRPLVQDSLFPTAAYVAGPAEVAYLAQAGSIYDCLGRLMPPVFPRITATLVEPSSARVMRKYDLSIEDVFKGVDALRTKVVGLGSEVHVFDEVRARLEDEIERLRPALEGVDQTLGGALDNSAQKILHQVDSLRARFVKGESRRNEVLDRQLNALTERLFPERKLQERVVNVVSFLARYGLNLVPMMDARMELDGSFHQIVEL
jgi:uncharacterized protein YllA (UPF0747 family)